MDSLPPPEMVFKAIDIYLRYAYAPDSPPRPILQRVDQLRRTDPTDFFTCPIIEHDKIHPSARHIIRLGNRFYPHMKISIDRRPDGKGYLFRADTHDRHIHPTPGSRDAAMFRSMIEQNHKLSLAIESEWAANNIPTFRSYLKEDLARRANTPQ